MPSEAIFAKQTTVSVFSDLHLEFYDKKKALSIIDSLVKSDICILAGDICNDKHFNDYINHFCDKYPYVVYIPGNHEFWGKSFNYVFENLDYLKIKHSNFHPLYNNLIMLNGLKIFGTVDFPPIPKGFNHRSIDLARMIGTEIWWDKEVKNSNNYLNTMTKMSALNTAPDIIVTHFMPTEKGINYRYKDSDINWYFCTYRDELLKKVKKDMIWIHGHVHQCYRAQVGKVKVICNPMGYPNEQKDFLPYEKFNNNLIITLD